MRSSELLGTILQVFKKSKTADSACASAFALIASRRSSFSASSEWRPSSIDLSFASKIRIASSLCMTITTH